MKKKHLAICTLALLSLVVGCVLLVRPSSARGVFIYNWLDDYSPPERADTRGKKENSFSSQLSKAAIQRTKHRIIYDPSYVKISYPGGDVPTDTGVCTDVVVRAYRKLGIDLQQHVHRDMQNNFKHYPKLWGLPAPDTNIDHRRVPNLMVFFRRKGTTLPISGRAEDYSPGDIVVWNLMGSTTHIGIVVDRRSKDGKRPLIVHNIGSGPVLEDGLFSWRIIGHFRYLG